MAGPQHLWDVYDKEQLSQEYRLDRSNGQILDELSDADVNGEVVGLTRYHDCECPIGGDDVTQYPSLLGLNDSPQRRIGVLSLVTFRLELLDNLLRESVQIPVLVLEP